MVDIDLMIKKSDDSIEDIIMEPNKIVKLAESKKINVKRNKSKKNSTLAYIFFSILLLAFIAPISIYKISKSRATYLDDDTLSIVGLAAIRSFSDAESENIHFIKNSNSQKNNYNSFETKSLYKKNIDRYRFGKIKITNAIKFQISVQDNDDEAIHFFNEKCGVGLLDVIVADFSIDINDNNEFTASLPSITIYGENGYITYLRSNGIYDDNGARENYSSHKLILKNEVIKKFTPPYYTIIYNNNYKQENYIAFYKSKNVLQSEFPDGKYTKFNFDIDSIKELSEDKLINIFDLINPKDKTVSALIVGFLDNGNILVKIFDDKHEIHIDDKCLINNNQRFDSYADLFIENIDKMIEITYGEIYDGYIPYTINAWIINFIE